jgi:hypothetical protein
VENSEVPTLLAFGKTFAVGQLQIYHYGKDNTCGINTNEKKNINMYVQ